MYYSYKLADKNVIAPYTIGFISNARASILNAKHYGLPYTFVIAIIPNKQMEVKTNGK